MINNTRKQSSFARPARFCH